MLFQGRLDRARKLQRSLRGLPEKEGGKRAEDGAEEFAVEEPKLKDEMERGDLFAMLVAALYTVFLPAAGILALVVGIAYLLFSLG